MTSLPRAGAGVFDRPDAAEHRWPVRFPPALASIGVERVFDGLLLVGLMMLAIASPAFPRHAQIGTTSVSGLATGAAGVFPAVPGLPLLVVPPPAPCLAPLRRVTTPGLPPRFGRRPIPVPQG